MALACDTRVEHEHGKRSAQLLKRGLVLGRLRHAVVQQVMHGKQQLRLWRGVALPVPLAAASHTAALMTDRRRCCRLRWRRWRVEGVVDRGGNVSNDLARSRPSESGCGWRAAGAGAVGAWAAPRAAGFFYRYPARRRSHGLLLTQN